MITNVFFNPIHNKQEQLLLENLIVESIQVMGTNVYYVARKPGNPDPIYGEDPTASYEQTWLVEMYLQNYLEFQGDGDIITKFAGTEVRDQVIYSMSRRRFNEDIGTDTGFSRPREGDLLFDMLRDRCFKIMYVDNFEMSYPLGALYSWKMTAELFEYSGEKFNTGIPQLDRIEKVGSMNIMDYLLLDVDGTPLLTENGDYLTTDAYDLSKIAPISDNANLKTEILDGDYIDWANTNPFGDWVDRGTETI